jgi:hypothetical protein
MLAPMPPLGKLEIAIKIDELPADVTTTKNGWKEFKLDCGARIVTVALRPPMWAKLEDASKQWPLWLAAISGQMGPSQGSTSEGFLAMRAAAR